MIFQMNTYLTETIEAILEKTDRKRVISFCKKVLKKCSFTAWNDLRNLGDLAAWLYVYGEYEDALKVCDIVKDVSFTGNYTLWEEVDMLLCIKARILREAGEQQQAEELVRFINRYRTPSLYPNLVPWFTETLDANIREAVEVVKSKASERDHRKFKMMQAIKFREPGNSPFSDEELEAIIHTQIDIIKKMK